MGSRLFHLTLLVLSACIVIPLSAPQSIPNFEIMPFRIAFSSFTVVLAGLVRMTLLRIKRHYFFVCGVCELVVVDETDLRKHYVAEHVKKEK